MSLDIRNPVTSHIKGLLFAPSIPWFNLSKMKLTYIVVLVAALLGSTLGYRVDCDKVCATSNDVYCRESCAIGNALG